MEVLRLSEMAGQRFEDRDGGVDTDEDTARSFAMDGGAAAPGGGAGAPCGSKTFRSVHFAFGGGSPGGLFL